MRQTIKKHIKKIQRHSQTLSLQETNYDVLVEANGCSTFLGSSGLLARGEFNNQKSEERNALVTFRDPATAEVRGGDT